MFQYVILLVNGKVKMNSTYVMENGFGIGLLEQEQFICALD